MNTVSVEACESVDRNRLRLSVTAEQTMRIVAALEPGDELLDYVLAEIRDQKGVVVHELGSV
jgi:hypothetical protein